MENNEFDFNKAQHIESWLYKTYDNFNIEIKMWKSPDELDVGVRGEYHWCLYVTIFKGHRLFEKASNNKSDYDMDLGNAIYPGFHCGCTYYNKQADYVKIGCDYSHLNDEYFMDSAELPDEIIGDAKDLFDFMKNAMPTE